MKRITRHPVVQKIIQLDLWLDKQWVLYIFLLAVVFLRVPNFSEPYWYGDEAIYLTIGNALNHGQKLYLDIVDHKTPLIYHLARVPSQMHFRLLLTAWMLASTTFFYYLAKLLFHKLPSVILATTLFVLATTLPWLEGNIPNGELFMMGFVLPAAVLALLSFSKVDHTTFKINQVRQLLLPIGGAGLLVGLAVLTKVPALLDYGALALLPIFYFSQTVKISSLKSWKHNLLFPVSWIGILSVGMVLAVIGSIVYSLVRGTGDAYLQYGLLYNFHYSGTWVPQLRWEVLQPLTQLSVKAVLMLLMLLSLFVFGLFKKVSLTAQFLLGWTATALFATLLSNRPYPHYFLQLVPPVSLLLGLLLDIGLTTKKTMTSLTNATVTTACAMLLLGSIAGIWYQLGVFAYPTVEYYQTWYNFVSGKISPTEYRNSFDSLIADNYAAAQLLKDQQGQPLYIWGTNPLLYAQTKTIPADAFTVAFHVKDLDAFDATIASVQDVQPEYIVMMKNEQGTFPALESYLYSNYLPYMEYEHYTIWKVQAWKH